MTARRLLANATLQMCLTVIIVVLATILASGHFLRLDVSRDRLHSLDEASKQLVGTLERPLVVRVYFTPGLEAPYNNHQQVVQDKLDELVAYSRGKMQVSFYDPTDDVERIAEANKFGLAPLQYTVRQDDRAELRSVWMGAALLYGDRVETLPALTNLASLEYDLVSAIHRMTQKVEDRKVIAYSIGHGEPDLSKPEGPMRALVEGMGRKAWLLPVELGGEGLLAEEVDALLVIGPQVTLPERALYQIDQFVMRGGAAAVFLTHTRPDMRTLRTERVNSGLEPLLGSFGVKANRDVVLDRVQNGAMRFPVRVGNKTGSREINYPLIVKATDLSAGSVLTAGIDNLVTPFVSSLELAQPLPEGVRAEVLARSSPSSGSVTAVASLDPSALTGVLDGEKRGPFALAVTLQGAWRSFYETRPAPPPDDEVPSEQDGMGDDAALVSEGAPTRLFVAASADMVANNSTFVLNLADWLIQDEALIGIRSKNATLPSLRATTPGERAGWKAFNLLLGPVLLVSFGATRQWALRRRASRSAS